MQIDTQEVLKKIEMYRGVKTCSQAILTAFCEVAGLPTDNLDKISVGFTGGIGVTFDEGTCGAVTSVVLALGFVCDDETQITLISNKVFNEFKEKYGTVNCGPLSDHGSNKLQCINVCLFAAETACNCLNRDEHKSFKH